jgi:hypothetical protein
LVDPPCIYELTIPGRGFYPYAYISALQVDHVGTRRILKNSIGKDVIVPDAFKVHIEFKSLTSDVNNFIVPAMGSAGIDVSKRYGISKVSEDPKDQTIKSNSDGSSQSTGNNSPASPAAAAEKKPEPPGIMQKVADFFSPSKTAENAMKK